MINVLRMFRSLLGVTAIFGAFGLQAHAQLSAREILTHMPGRWVGVASGEDVEKTLAEHCETDGMDVTITEDSEGKFTYESRFDSGHIDRSDVKFLRDEAGEELAAIFIQYEDEKRRTSAGSLVSWILLMPSKDQHFWIRYDWLSSGGRTPPWHRCRE